VRPPHIAFFLGRWEFLSNFYPSEVKLKGKTYPTVEHAFQAAKTLDEADRERIRLAETAGQAKAMGRKVALRSGWAVGNNGIRVQVMRALLKQKFAPGTELAQKLLDTEDREIVEGNTWNDTFWGVCNGKGKNRLGELLMAIREELRNADPESVGTGEVD
jgi:ribA/ribD-fused uncharacterized protein